MTTFRSEPRESDIGSVGNMVRATGFFSTAEVEIAMELVSERVLKGPASGYEFMLAEDGDSLRGYACFGEIPCTVGSYDLYWIVVHPNAQGAGLGRKLLTAVEDRIALAMGRKLYADTSGRAQYASTRSFYEHTGFFAESRLADYYAPGDDKLIYGKTISVK